MKKFLLIFSVSLISMMAMAQEGGSSKASSSVTSAVVTKTPRPAATRFEIYPLNYQMRFERNEDQILEGRATMQSFGLGVSRGRVSSLLEISKYGLGARSGVLRVDRQHVEALLWLRRDLAKFSWLRVQGGIGAGASQDEVTTRMLDEEAKDAGRWDALGAASLGGSVDIKETLRLSLEGRLFFGSNLDPNPQPDVVLRTGFLF